MLDDFDEDPELAGYEPHPRRGRRQKIIRAVVIIAVFSLVVPGVLMTLVTANSTAQYLCDAYTARLAPTAVDSSARFELLGAARPGWNCYATTFSGEQVLLVSLGLIPGPPASR